MKQLIEKNNKKILNNEEPEYFDVIIVDPPKLAPSKQSLPSAIKKYAEINALAMALLCPKNGGFLCTFSCSAHITQRQILIDILKNASNLNVNKILNNNLNDNNNNIINYKYKQIDILKSLFPSIDHPLNIEFLDGSYLSGYLTHVK